MDRLKTRRRATVNLSANGGAFFSPAQIATVARPNIARIVKKIINDYTAKGHFFFVSDKVYYDDDAERWTGNKPARSSANVDINVIDKNKVWSIQMFTQNVSRQYALNSTRNYQDLPTAKKRRGSKRLKTGARPVSSYQKSNPFLHEVAQCKNPKATWTRFVTVTTDNCSVLNAGVNGKRNKYKYGDANVNMANVNMGRGRYEAIVLQYLIAARYRRVNRRSFVQPVLQFMRLNNNNITVDAVVSSVANQETLKQSAGRADSDETLQVLAKNSFKTYKIVKTLDGANTYHKNNACGSETTTIELQAHPRCFNCSAIKSVELLPILKDICAQLMNTPSVEIDACLVNAKSYVERLSNSLISVLGNDFCETLCDGYDTKNLPSPRHQCEFFHSTIKPRLAKMEWSRDNFAQFTTFSNVVALVKYYSLEDREQVSKKYANEDTVRLFSNRHDGKIKTVKRRRCLGIQDRLTHDPRQFADNYDLQ